MRGLTLTTKEQSRIQVLNGVIEGKVTVAKPESTDAERPWGWNKGCGPWDATVRAQFR